MTPMNAMMLTIGSWYCYTSDSHRRWPKPGAVIEKMPPDVREALQRLTPEDLNKIRVDKLELDSRTTDLHYMSRLCRAFDRKLRRA